ncbi:MAG: hypothetical protein QM607_03045, partial [Microbacterium sp.]
GVIGWMVTPKILGTRRDRDDHAALNLAPTERVVWAQTVRVAREGAIVLVIACLSLVAVVVVGATSVMQDMSVMQDADASTRWVWVLSAIGVLTVFAVISCVVFHITVDDTGLTVRSFVGFPCIRIARGDIARVQVVDVNPMGECGGWGWRYGIGKKDDV